MAKLGFVGLGIMGTPMALHLMKAGHQVALWSHTPGKAQRIAGKVATICETPADVARHSEFVFLCVGNSEMSREVIMGRNGLVKGAQHGLVIVDCSTIAPAESRRMASELFPLGIDFLDAPCTGSKNGAESGTLTFMVGGRVESFERIRPYLLTMGKQLYYCGASGMGLHVKLSQNLIIGNLLQALNESLVLSTKAGIAPRLMLEVLNNSAAKSDVIAAKAPKIFDRVFATEFSVKWLEKDMRLMLDSAAELQVPLPLTAVSQRRYRVAIDQGYGEEDICGAIRTLESAAGCEVIEASAPALHKNPGVGNRSTDDQ